VTNLSELLPSGGGAKEFSAVASGTLTNGQTVALISDGKIEAISETAEAATTEADFTSTSLWSGGNQSTLSSVYDVNADRVVQFYASTTSTQYCTGVVSTPTASGLTDFGTPVVINTSDSDYISAVYHVAAQKSVVGYRDGGASNYGRCCVITVDPSDNSLTFGTENNFSTDPCVGISSTYDSTNEKVVFTFMNTSGDFGNAVVGTISGTSISFGLINVFGNISGTGQVASWTSCVYEANSNSVTIFWARKDQSNHLYCVVGQVSGTGFNSSSPVLVDNAFGVQNTNLASVADTNSNKIVVFYQNANNGDGYGVVGTPSYVSNVGSATFGSPVEFTDTVSSSTASALSCAFDSTNNKVVVMYRNTADDKPYVNAITVVPSNESMTVANEFNLTTTKGLATEIIFVPTITKFVASYIEEPSPYYGKYVLYNVNVQNASDFIGITSQAIANSATGKVNPQGGVATAQALNSGVAGTPVSATPINGNRNSLAYDSNSNRIALSYADGNNNEYGTCVVGQVDSANSSITFGTAVVFNTASTNDALNATTFDSSSNKIVVAFRDAGNSNKGYARVGTIDPSNNSISFPSASVEFEAGAVRNIVSTFDSSTSRIVIAYEDEGNSEKGTAIVGQVSGNTINFGTPVVFNDADTQDIDIAYGGNKVVIVFEDVGNSKKNTAIVGTVDPSDDSITYGSEAVYDSTTASKLGNAIAYDATAQKFVIAYCDTSDGESGKALTGTVSGTNITFGTVAQFATQVDLPVATYNSGFGQVIIAYGDNDNSRAATALGANVSGTDLTFTTALLVDGSTGYKGPLSLTYDSTANKTVTSYRDGGDTNKVDVTVFTVEGLGPFTVNSTYYVQNNGNLSTTSSSVTAGKAISTTQLILNGAS